jgi:hypothetical protein
MGGATGANARVDTLPTHQSPRGLGLWELISAFFRLAGVDVCATAADAAESPEVM